jgi:hypothetical protein
LRPGRPNPPDTGNARGSGGVSVSPTPIERPEEITLPTPAPGGTTYTDLSENFEITVYPIRIVMDEDVKRLCYRVFFLNKILQKAICGDIVLTTTSPNKYF